MGDMRILERLSEAPRLLLGRPRRLLAGLLATAALATALTACTAAQGDGLTMAPVPMEATAPAADVVVIGDSLSTGLMTSPADAWPTLIQNKLSSSTPAKSAPRSLYNAAENGAGYIAQGSAGDTFGDEVRRAVTNGSKEVLFFGSDNDLGDNPDDIARAAASALAQAHAQAPKATLIVVGPPSYSETPDSALTAIRDALQSASKQEGARFVDPITEDWIAPQAAQLLADDGEHPSVAGHQLLASKMETLLGIA
ncbi:SGNH/GDSL hydrolase family protein [Arthrobacter sp. NPDC090010]|uniref:SGNH/GDSL hydrolase family protein n=1 Tax=Arthrobacter sp. NPDC090010 TaxID=3363942 RepID=UPI0037F3D374